ncbi:MAG: class I SAM-dependent methyltransferase [Methanomassiliicoccales archaeon]
MADGRGPEATILGEGSLDLGLLERYMIRPPMFTPGKEFWSDPYISGNILRAHLDPRVEVASRSPEDIEASVDWLMDHLDLGPGSRVLDLGCGPGLYAERLASRRAEVTGVDISRRSIEHARGRAEDKGLDIDYRHGDYLEEDLGTGYDAAFLIYGDLCTLPDPDRDLLLGKVRRALRSGGKFAFDVMTMNHRAAREFGNRWYACSEGFWRSDPHLVLEHAFGYPEHDTFMEQYLVIDQEGEVDVYRVWFHYYSRKTIYRVLEENGFHLDGTWADLKGTPFSEGSHWIGVVASR